MIYRIFDKQCICSSAHITCGSIMASNSKPGLEEESAIEIEKRETSEEKHTRC